MRPGAAALLAALAAAVPAAPLWAGKAGELPGLVDKVLADPSDAKARDRLGEAAEQAVSAERAAAEAERAALLADAEKARLAREAMEAAKRRRVEDWRRRFDKACSLAGSPDKAGDAVALYEGLLETFPVYSDTRELLTESGAKIRKIFYETIRRTHPYLAEGRETADERMLAALQFTRASVRQMEYGGRQPAGVAEAQLKKAQQLRDLENGLKEEHSILAEGLSLFTRKRWAEAAAKLEEVADFDRENEEALHYLALARSKLGPAASPAAPPQEKPARAQAGKTARPAAVKAPARKKKR